MNMLFHYLKNQQPNTAIVETYKVLSNEVLAEYGIEEGKSSINWQLQQTSEDEGLGIPAWLLIIIVVIVVLFLDFKFFGGFLTHILLSILSRGGRGGGGGGGGPVGEEEVPQVAVVQVEDGERYFHLIDKKHDSESNHAFFIRNWFQMKVKGKR